MSGGSGGDVCASPNHLRAVERNPVYVPPSAAAPNWGGVPAPPATERRGSSQMLRSSRLPSAPTPARPTFARDRFARDRFVREIFVRLRLRDESACEHDERSARDEDAYAEAYTDTWAEDPCVEGACVDGAAERVETSTCDDDESSPRRELSA